MNIPAAVDALQRQHDAAMKLLRSHGWYPYGSHMDRPDVKLEFSAEGPDGLPYFERVWQ